MNKENQFERLMLPEIIISREMQQDEIPSQEPLFENTRFPMGYGEGNGYSKVGPLYDMSNYRAEVKRSLNEHMPTQRQTGIIYGGGKPIGILQVQLESSFFQTYFLKHRYYLKFKIKIIRILPFIEFFRFYSHTRNPSSSCRSEKSAFIPSMEVDRAWISRNRI